VKKKGGELEGNYKEGEGLERESRGYGHPRTATGKWPKKEGPKWEWVVGTGYRDPWPLPKEGTNLCEGGGKTQ